MTAIVLDGQLKSALAAVRSLGEKGIPVSVGAERTTAMSLHSRFASHTFTYPSPYTNEGGFIDAVEAEAKRLGDMPVAIPCSDATYLALYHARERLSASMTLLFPDERAIETAFDKGITYSLARVSGVPTIPTLLPGTREELVRIASSLTYPAVVKPRKSVTTCGGVRHFGSAQFVHTKEGLVALSLQLTDTLGEPPLIQERVNGEEYGVETIAHKGVPYALVTHHRLRSLSPTGGASVLKETVEKGALRDMLETYTRKLLGELKWTGPIMVEFKVDSDTKTPMLMEINGRFWGSLPLSIFAGVDMPYYYYYLLTHGALPTDMVAQRDGVVTRHFLGDVRHLIRVLFSSDKMRRHMFPKRLAALKSFFVLPKGTHGDVWLLTDPKPAVMECIDMIKKVWK